MLYEIMIHPSHSRKELIEIIELFQIYQVDNYKDLKKTTMSWKLWEVLTDTKYIKPDNEHYFIKDVTQLRDYLRRPSNRQVPNAAVREDVDTRVKHLMFYYKCGFSFLGSNYNTIEEVLADAHFVSNYGDKPAVSRVLRFLNGSSNTHGDQKMPYKIEPVLTKRGREKKKRIEKVKADTTLRFRIGGPATLIFE
jgi:hypothetical protein